MIINDDGSCIVCKVNPVKCQCLCDFFYRLHKETFKKYAQFTDFALCTYESCKICIYNGEWYEACEHHDTNHVNHILHCYNLNNILSIINILREDGVGI